MSSMPGLSTQITAPKGRLGFPGGVCGQRLPRTKIPLASHLPASRCPLEDGLRVDQRFMTRLEYELLREQEPQLHLPSWNMLITFPWENSGKRFSSMVDRIHSLDRDTLIASRTAVLLAAETPALKL